MPNVRRRVSSPIASRPEADYWPLETRVLEQQFLADSWMEEMLSRVRLGTGEVAVIGSMSALFEKGARPVKRLPKPGNDYNRGVSRTTSAVKLISRGSFRERLMNASPALACALRFYEDRQWVGGANALSPSMSSGHIRTRWPSLQHYAIMHDSAEVTGKVEEINSYRKWWIAEQMKLAGRGQAFDYYSLSSPGVRLGESFFNGMGFILHETERMFTILHDELEELYGR